MAGAALNNILSRCEKVNFQWKKKCTVCVSLIKPSLQAVVGACVVAKSLQHSLKEDASPVCVADLCCQALIVRILRERLSDVEIVAEEDLLDHPPSVLEAVCSRLNELAPRVGFQWSPAELLSDHQATHLRSVSEAKGDTFFIVDPIDGTKGFLRKAHFAIGFCCCRRETAEVLFSVIGCPTLPSPTQPEVSEPGALFVAVRGSGARRVDMTDLLNEKEEVEQQAISVRELRAMEPSDCLIVMESFEPTHSRCSISRKIVESLRKNKIQFIQLDGMGKFAFIANGSAHTLLRFPDSSYQEKIWDILPGLCLVEESGGRVSHGDGSSIKLVDTSKNYLTNTSGIVVASSEILFKNILETIKQ